MVSLLAKLITSGAIWRADEATPSDDTTVFSLLQRGSLHEWFYEGQEESIPPPFTVSLSLLNAALKDRSKVKNLWRDTGKQEIEKNKKDGVGVIIERDKVNSSKIQKLIFLIGKEVWPTPYFLRDCFSDGYRSQFRHFIFLDPPNEKEKVWAVETALSSPRTEAVVSHCAKLPFALSQKFLLASKKSGALGFLFRHKKELSLKSAAHSRWKIGPVPYEGDLLCWKLSLLHAKGSYPKTHDWTIECQNEKKISLNILPELVGEPCAEKTSHKRFA